MQDNANTQVIDFGRLPTTDPAQLTEAGRQAILEEVMGMHEKVADAWSKADFPNAADDAVQEHERLEQELINLVGRVMHLPDSVEGIRFLERWFDSRVKQLADMMPCAKAGTLIQMAGEDTCVQLNEDMAKGMRLGLLAAQSLFHKFPINMEITPRENAEG